MAHHYMTKEERYKLEALYNNARMPVAKIAKELGFSRQTIYAELKLGSYLHTIGYYRDVVRYSAHKAQQLHDYAQSGKGRPEKIGKRRDYADYLERKILQKKYSPAAALADARQAGYDITICTSTLYTYIDKGLFQKLKNKHLWVKGKKKKTAEKPERRIAHEKLPSIEQRPEHISSRKEFGHWEVDLIVGKEKTTAVLLSMTERITRMELIFLLPNRKAATVKAAFDRIEKTMPNFKDNFKSITTDNGSEFLKYNELVQSIHGGKRFEVYYCHSYSAWEKGSVENHNRMIRRFFPKGTDFTKVKKSEITKIQNWINGYPRKILNWETPMSLFALAQAG